MSPARGKFTLERTWSAPIARVWELWTTAEGLESWWGPDGFTTKVLELDLRPGGEWRYARATCRKLQPRRRLDYTHDAEWTGRARMGWESQLARLSEVVSRGGR